MDRIFTSQSELKFTEQEHETCFTLSVLSRIFFQSCLVLHIMDGT